MDATAFLARVEDYHKAGWRLALINVTTVLPVVSAYGPPAAGSAATAAAAAPAPVPEAPHTETHATAGAESPGVFEIAWAFARDGQFETIREQIAPGDAVPSVSDFFGAAFLYENEIRELFGINVTGIGVDLRGQLYQTATKVPFSHAAVKARLAAVAAAAAAAAAATVKPS
jgi:hypothetical protein